MMMMNSAGSTRAAWSFHCAETSMMPMPHAAANITGKFSILPITAAASAFTRIDGPSAGPSGSPMVPARRIMVTAERKAAIIHATLWVNPTFTPRSDERSALSELARSAMPMLVKRRNAPEPDDAEQRDDHADEIVGVEDDRMDLEAEVEGLRQRLRRDDQVVGEPVGQHDREEHEELRQADGDDHQDQARRLGEPTDDHALDHRPEHD